MKSTVQRGFSLIEVILVITVGLGLIMSATLIYLSAKDSAGMTKGRDKVLSLQGIVEQFAATNGMRYPTIVQTAQLWTEKIQDFRSSPWGGVILTGLQPIPSVTATFYPGIDGQGGDTGIYPLDDLDPSGTVPYVTLSPAPTTPGIVGMVQYRRIANNQEAALFDFSINKAATGSGYMVSIRGKDGNEIFIQGGPTRQ